jgi:stalled ribosome alternative rescue factor ArfA
MKPTRSTVGKSLNLSPRIEPQKKGRGSYRRKTRNGRGSEN